MKILKVEGSILLTVEIKEIVFNSKYNLLVLNVLINDKNEMILIDSQYRITPIKYKKYLKQILDRIDDEPEYKLVWLIWQFK